MLSQWTRTIVDLLKRRVKVLLKFIWIIFNADATFFIVGWNKDPTLIVCDVFYLTSFLTLTDNLCDAFISLIESN